MPQPSLRGIGERRFPVGGGHIHSTRSRAEHVSLWERAVSALRVSGPGLSASVGVPAGGRWLFVVRDRPGRRDLLQREGRAQPPDGNFPSPGLSWGLSCGVNFPAGRCGLSISCLGGVSPGAECVCRNNLPDFGAPPAGGMTQKLGKSPSLRPCGTGRTFFLSGVVGDPAHLVSFLFHSQFFPCAVGDPSERFLFSGEKEGFRHLYSAVLFLHTLAFRALRQEVRGLWRFFLWSLLCSGMFRNRLFSWGESFSGRHLFRTFLSTWACSCCEGERGVHRPFMGTFLPPAIFFRGISLSPVLSWGLS